MAADADSAVGCNVDPHSASHQNLISVVELLRSKADSVPNEDAFVFLNASNRRNTISWSEHLDHANRLSHIFTEAGLQRGETILIQAQSGYEWEVTQMAAWICGACVGAVSPTMPAAQLESVLQSLPISWLIHLASNEALKISRVGRLGEIVETSCFDVFDESNGSGATRKPFDVDCGDLPALLTFTSGSTGKPKGLLFTHKQIALAIDAFTTTYSNLVNGDINLSWLPLENLFQRMINLACIAWGCKTYYWREAARIADGIREVAPHLFIGVPRTFEKFFMSSCNEGKETGPDLATVLGGRAKVLITGSAPSTRKVLQAYRDADVPLFEAYGLSENIIPMATNSSVASKIGSVGIAFKYNDIKSDSLNRLWVRSPGIYSRKYECGAVLSKGEPPELDSEGYYLTGDLAEVDLDGFITLIGRTTDLIKTSTGRRLAPRRIEDAYKAHPKIERIVVFGEGEELLVGLMVLDDSETSKLQLSLGLQIAELDAKHWLSPMLNDAANNLHPHERVGGWLISNSDTFLRYNLTTDNDKSKRHEIYRTFEGKIQKLYGHLKQHKISPRHEPVVWIV